MFPSKITEKKAIRNRQILKIPVQGHLPLMKESLEQNLITSSEKKLRLIKNVLSQQKRPKILAAVRPRVGRG